MTHKPKISIVPGFTKVIGSGPFIQCNRVYIPQIRRKLWRGVAGKTLLPGKAGLFILLNVPVT